MPRREKLKDRIRVPRVSSKAALLHGLIAVVAFVAVISTLSKRSLIDFVAQTWSGNGRIATAAEQDVTLTVSADHTYFWNASGPFPLDGFADRFAKWRKAVKRPQVRIAGDATARWGDAVSLLNEVQRQGVADAKMEMAPPAGAAR